MKTINLLSILFLILFPFYSKAQRFSVENLIEVKSMDISEASSYFEKKGWKLMQTRKNPDKTTEIFWTKGQSNLTMFRYILNEMNPSNSAVSVMFGDKSNFESLKKQAKQLGMELTNSGVDDDGHIFSIYASQAYRLRFSTSADKKMTYYEVFLIVSSNKS